MTHAAKHRIYGQFARLGKAMSASAQALELLDLLVQGERYGRRARGAGAELSVANASQHLQVLARGPPRRRRDKRRLYADPVPPGR
jgi:hypothetical protein